MVQTLRQNDLWRRIAIFGSVITIVLNIVLIPRFGYMGAAYASFACYFSMMVLSYFFGQKYYRVDYDVKRIILYVVTAFLLYKGTTFLPISNIYIKLGVHTLLLFGYAWFILILNPDMRKRVLQFVSRKIKSKDHE